jgi:hypothetical protein
MAHVDYYVVRHEGRWMIKHNGKYFGPYADQPIAIRTAIDAAHKTSASGQRAQVSVQGTTFNKWHVAWISDQHPYPPQG